MKHDLESFYESFPEDLRESIRTRQEETALKVNALFKTVDDYIENSDFLKKFPVQFFSKDDYIIQNYRFNPESSKKLAYLHQGQVKVSMERAISIPERRPVLAFCGGKSWLGFDSITSFGNTMCYSALTECQVSIIPWDWFFTEAPPEVHKAAIAQLSVDQSNSLIMASGRKNSLYKRVITGLRVLFITTNSQTLDISRVDMADFIGIERQYLSKVLKTLVKKNHVEIKKGSVYLINPHNLYDDYFNEEDEIED